MAVTGRAGRMAAMLPVAAASVLVGLLAGAAAQERGTVRVALEPVAASGVQGAATITTRGEAAVLAVEVAGLEPSASYAVRLHTGTGEQPSASAGLLGMLVADDTGASQLSATSAQVTAARVSVPLTPALLLDGDHVVTVQGMDTLACGAIPRSSQAPAVQVPAALPATGSPAAPPAAIGIGTALRR